MMLRSAALMALVFWALTVAACSSTAEGGEPAPVDAPATDAPVAPVPEAANPPAIAPAVVPAAPEVPKAETKPAAATTENAATPSPWRPFRAARLTVWIQRDWIVEDSDTGALVTAFPAGDATGRSIELWRDAVPVSDDEAARLAFTAAYRKAITLPEGFAGAAGEPALLAASGGSGAYGFDVRPGRDTGLVQLHRVAFTVDGVYTTVLTTRKDNEAADTAALDGLFAGGRADAAAKVIPVTDAAARKRADDAEKKALKFTFAVPDGWLFQVTGGVLAVNAPVGSPLPSVSEGIRVTTLDTPLPDGVARTNFMASFATSLVPAGTPDAEKAVPVADTTPVRGGHPAAVFRLTGKPLLAEGAARIITLVFADKRTFVVTLNCREPQLKAMQGSLAAFFAGFAVRDD
jgi:hypothetical protein